ncbi:MAG: copper resistance protein B [Thiobacillus sp.]
MMNIQMKLLAGLIAALSAYPAWAQTDAAADAMPGMDPGTMDHGAMPGMEPSTMDQGAMPGMDHSKMNHGAMPDTSTAQPGMNPDMSGSMEGMQGMDAGEMNMQGGPAPADARDPHAYSGGYTLESGPYSRSGPRELRLADEHNFGGLLVDRLEWTHANGGGNASAYDIQGWYGRDYDRLVVKAEGDVAKGKLEEARTELLWGHAIATFWDTQLGVRYDSGAGPDRGWLAFGVQGLAPYWFEVDAAAYVGDNGRTALRLGAEYELLITQKLIVQPRLELDVYGKSDAARGVGSGLSETQAGVRLRYEFTRQFAPYIGIERTSKFGQTADLARADGEKTGVTRWVAGVRFWF